MTVLVTTSMYSCRGRNMCFVGSDYYDKSNEYIKHYIDTHDLAGKNFFYYGFGLIHALIIETDSCYIGINERLETKNQIEGPPAYHCEKKYEFIFDLEEKPLKELFSWKNEPALNYNVAKNIDEYNPFWTFMFLCDSLGNAKIIADDKTEKASGLYYKKLYNKDIPVTKEQGKYISRILFPQMYEN